MGAGGTGLRLGPFKGGLNTASDPSAIQDAELAECINFDFDTDGALTSRPPIVDLLTGPVAVQTIDLLGYFVDSSGTNYLIGSTDNAVYYFGSGVWVQITTGFRATAMVQYLNKAWLVAMPGSASSGGSWVPTTFGAAGTFTTIASMPKGGAAGLYKERMFIVAGSAATTNESRISFSNLADPATWSGSDFIDVSPGDGQKLLDLFVIGSNMYLFKNDSTYIYSYDAAPTKGVINPISKSIGASDSGCVVQYENYLMVYHEDFVYEIINGVHQKLNTRVDFSGDFSGGTSYFKANSLSIVGDRLVVRYYDKVYVFNLKTRTWATWESAKVFSKWLTEPRPGNTITLRRYVANSAVVNTRDTYVIQDGLDSSATEAITCRATTKVYDFDSPEQFKKLYWWGVDVIAQGNVIGTITPVIFTFNVTWGSLASKTWGQMAAFTWGQPGDIVPIVVDTVSTSGSKGRRFIKFLKAIRFRNVSFTVQLETTGTTTTAPVKLFTINPVIGLKQRVPKKVN
jgi:hypothetical protein